MAYRKTLLLAFASLLVAACNAPSSVDGQIDAGGPAPAKSISTSDAAASTQPAEAGTASMTASHLLDSKFEKVMPYADLRALVMAEGWLPVRDSDCKGNVGGEALICDTIPELETCSTDGFCVMNFLHAATTAKLRVTTYGEYGDWNVIGPQSKLAVTGWRFSGDESGADTRRTQLSSEAGQQALDSGMPISADACTLEGHVAFLEAFARDDIVRAAYTSPQVRIRNFNKPDADVRLIDKSQYDQFRIGLVDYRWVYLDGAQDKNERIEIKQTRAGNTLRVDYVKAQFDAENNLVRTYGEPGAYLFEFIDGCWYLTQDLQ